MVKFNLRIEKNEEYGGFGIVFNTSRDYFEPALDGDVLAHDILEHPVTPHSNGYIDELMAIGGYLAGRVESGWMSKYGRRSNLDDLHSDIVSLATAALHADDDICPEVCNSYLQDGELMESIRSNIYKGLLEAVNDFEDGEHTYLPAKYNYDLESIEGWICKGYQLYKKRFSSNLYDTSTYLFDKIAEVCDKFLKQGEEGQTAELIINFSSLNAELIREEV
jgi:hypothetical protein